MKLDYSSNYEVIITMNRYIKEDLEEFPNDKWVPATSPESDHIFKVNEDGDILAEEQAIIFHGLFA